MTEIWMTRFSSFSPIYDSKSSLQSNGVVERRHLSEAGDNTIARPALAHTSELRTTATPTGPAIASVLVQGMQGYKVSWQQGNKNQCQGP
ncbi:hypothetical protein [Phormidium sp. FACHB-592]|uniref:hypothetical protein n=1 Tax=Phormidium sp. FACHB-592 TaxID=2692850 RepID=UPI001A7E75F4|nr:hypothetical protein [Phormidium sp. FACHB-592]